MANINKYGLPRTIPEPVKRQVRKNSKFGCVLCRKGFYQYEHIEPTFENAFSHNPDHICCLCGSCHDSVTRRQISKQAVLKAYEKLKNASVNEVAPPIGPLDFHDGNAELVVGKLVYCPVVENVLTYQGYKLITVYPGTVEGEPGRISAIFTNPLGEPILELKDNEWIGNIQNWDIEVIGTRIIVRRKLGEIIFKLRLDPPGRLIIEHLDMRIGDAHILITDKTYAVGRYLNVENVFWFHTDIEIKKSSIHGTAIEFLEPWELEKREKLFENLDGHKSFKIPRWFIGYAFARWRVL